jgi:WD40 repeat protein
MSGLVDRHEVLLAFARTLGAESYALRRRPALLWQQMHNGLAPLELSGVRALVATEADRRRREPWLRQRGGGGAAAMRVVASLATGIESCDWSGAAGLLGVGCRDGTVQTLDPDTGDATVLGTHEGPVTCCRFTPDGSFLVSGSNDSTLRVFRTATGQPCGTFRGHESPVTCLAVLPSGRQAVSGSQDRTLIVWEIETLQPVRTLRGHDRGVLCCALSADGRRLASGDTGGSVVVWDMNTGEQVRSIDAHDDAVLCCALDPGGDFLATGAADSSARIWHLDDERPPTNLVGHTDEVAGCGFAGDDLLVTVSADGSVRSWDVSTGAALAAALGQGGPITSAVLRDGGRVAYTGSTNGSALAWSVADLGEATAASGHSAAVTCAVASPRGDVATSSLDGSAIVWRLSDGRAVHQLRCDEPLTGCALRGGGATLVTSGSHKPLIEWDVATGARRRTLPVRDVVLCCASDPTDGPLVLGTMEGLTVNEPDGSSWRHALEMDLGTEANSARLREAEFSRNLPAGITRQELGAIRRTYEAQMAMPGIDRAASQCVTVQPGGRLAAVGDVLGRVTLIDLRTHAVVRVIPAPRSGTDASARAVALAPDAAHVAVGYSDGAVAVYSLEKPEEAVRWKEHGAVLACAFSGDSQLLAIGTQGQHLSVWEWRERTEVYHLPMAHVVRACAFAADEPVVVCGDAAGNVRIAEMIGLAGMSDPSPRLGEQ